VQILHSFVGSIQQYSKEISDLDWNFSSPRAVLDSEKTKMTTSELKHYRSPFRSAAASVLALAVTLAAFSSSPRPTAVCSQETQGLFWPLEANHDPMLLETKALAGDLWVCRGDYDWDAYFVQTIHFFKWRQMTVRVNRAKPIPAKEQATGE
jgi:hypothetical protein